jgi:hypothetical protein
MPDVYWDRSDGGIRVGYEERDRPGGSRCRHRLFFLHAVETPTRLFYPCTGCRRVAWRRVSGPLKRELTVWSAHVQLLPRSVVRNET